MRDAQRRTAEGGPTSIDVRVPDGVEVTTNA